jgi:hypothetical protein
MVTEANTTIARRLFDSTCLGWLGDPAVAVFSLEGGFDA